MAKAMTLLLLVLSLAVFVWAYESFPGMQGVIVFVAIATLAGCRCSDHARAGDAKGGAA